MTGKEKGFPWSLRTGVPSYQPGTGAARVLQTGFLRRLFVERTMEKRTAVSPASRRDGAVHKCPIGCRWLEIVAATIAPSRGNLFSGKSRGHVSSKLLASLQYEIPDVLKYITSFWKSLPCLLVRKKCPNNNTLRYIVCLIIATRNARLILF